MEVTFQLDVTNSRRRQLGTMDSTTYELMQHFITAHTHAGKPLGDSISSECSSENVNPDCPVKINIGET